MNLAEMWSELVDQAMELDPDQIRRSILATRDDGLRATSYDGPRVMGGTVDSHPERLAMHPPTDHTDADLRLLDSLVGSYVQAVAEIAARSRSGRPCATWEEAVKDHHLLDQMDAVSILERIESPRRWVLKAGDALHDLARLERRHSRRVPDPVDLMLTGDPVCLSHARIGDYERPRHGGLVLCKTCRDLVAAVAEPTEVHKDSMWWPPVELLREHAHMERTGVRAEYRRLRAEWISGLGRTA